MKRSLQLVLAGLLCAVLPSSGHAQLASSADQSKNTQLAAVHQERDREPEKERDREPKRCKKDIEEDKREIKKDQRQIVEDMKRHDLDDLAADEQKLAEDEADLHADVASRSTCEKRHGAALPDSGLNLQKST
jgi:hypothetical protein